MLYSGVAMPMYDVFGFSRTVLCYFGSAFLRVARLPADDGISGLTDADPPDGDPEPRFDFENVILSRLGQVLELPAGGDGLVPAGHRDVLDLNPLEVLSSLVNSLKTIKGTIIN
jgi:hypothetical protein